MVGENQQNKHANIADQRHSHITRQGGFLTELLEGPDNCRPGYGLYDRALGIMYMLGAWDLMDKEEKNR